MVAGGRDRHLTGDPMADDAPETLEAFRHFREKMNAAVLAADNLTVKRFFALDTRAYEDGALPARTKELLGLVASLVLRCDDCVTYHLVRCRELGVSEAEIHDGFSVALVVGGSIVIPHLRRAVARLEELPSPPSEP
jgi:AhpD family alkylhydroperoxidase